MTTRNFCNIYPAYSSGNKQQRASSESRWQNRTHSISTIPTLFIHSRATYPPTSTRLKGAAMLSIMTFPKSRVCVLQVPASIDQEVSVRTSPQNSLSRGRDSSHKDDRTTSKCNESAMASGDVFISRWYKLSDRWYSAVAPGEISQAQ